jgi:hypothetical protein
LKSSARSALTEGSDSLTLVLIHPEVKLGYRSHARSTQAKESLSCGSEQSIEGLLLQVCAESKGFKHLKCLKDLPQGVQAGGFSEIFRTDKAQEV